MIYLKLRGRIGNQLFIYSAARMVQILKGEDETIIIEDTNNHSPEGIEYANSLVNYELPNVRYIHEESFNDGLKIVWLRLKRKILYRLLENGLTNDQAHERTLRLHKFYEKLGIINVQDGYIPFPKKFSKNTYIDGYYQSEKYFTDIKDEIKNRFRIEDELKKSNYPNLDLMRSRNTVCISIKVQHNVGNYMYDVCHQDYYEKAIEYIISKVDNPLFFICSDNVEYVKENLIDTSKYDVVCQASDYPVHLSLAAMAQCKHFIIGNTSFGWWAQYLSDNPDKIVIVPDRWYNGMGDWQYDIYTEYMKIISTSTC
ncbi:Glycosyl transferase family 11 [Pseudobutyrivibrio sp. UC1225]|uniref:alpha-1,2-fucosyltransferase n=1 Tax=Pseudobutyrivibrio sp. UC1225 TaxID=1798185 RepID=UPI0008F3856B|nr:alpha-1,2-fucosyltransferase [Pseudobutyrivibrio sp. UC1225]SFN78552.1 Glycosyl transferase family 11 [Pseudobutyrivibrio sp. UC1225]